MSTVIPLRESLRQMVAVLQDERQALAALDLDGIVAATVGKGSLCDAMAITEAAEVDDECRGLLEAARRLNEVNRQIRNLIAANVLARLDAIAGSPALYRAPASYAYARTWHASC